MNNTEKASAIKQHYSKWLSNKELVEKLKISMEKVGYPLEISARSTLHKRGYTENLGQHYSQKNKDGEEIWREIDVHVTNNTPYESDIYGCTFLFNVSIIAECKYSSTNDFFIFENEKGLGSFDFPILLNRKRFANSIGSPTFKEIFDFPTAIQNIAEVNVTGQDFHPTNKVIFDAANQLASAISFFAQEDEDSFRELYEEDPVQEIISNYKILYQQAYQKVLGQKKIGERTDADYQEVYRTVAEKIFPQFVVFPVKIWIPIIIVGGNNGIIRVVMDNDRVGDLKELGFGIYKFTPSVLPQSFRKAWPVRHHIPIILCNVNFLNECLDFLEKRIPKLIEISISKIKGNPLDAIELYEELLLDQDKTA